MGARRTARERALQALFQLDGEPVTTGPAAALAQAWSASDDEGPVDPAAQSFALEIIEGVRSKLAELDPLLEKHSHNWRLDRMSRVDRNVLRLGAWELKFRDDIPRKVTLNEAVELGKKFGNEESSAFINGLLDKIASALGKP
jgi:N utilization substance protein B